MLFTSQLDQESIINVRVADAVDKVKQRAEEDKQSVLMETRKQIREAVTNVRTEMETRMTTASTAAVQEAIKEAHKQSSSKEVCITSRYWVTRTMAVQIVGT